MWNTVISGSTPRGITPVHARRTARRLDGLAPADSETEIAVNACKQMAHSVQKQSEKKQHTQIVMHLKECADSGKLAKLIDSMGMRQKTMSKLDCKPIEIVRVVDNCSVEIVADAGTPPGQLVTPSKASEKGVAYASASNTVMPNREGGK